MIHGFKYKPGDPRHCPHRKIMALDPETGPFCSPSWPRQLGFGTGHATEGLAIAFGWQSRAGLRQARTNAIAAGTALADVLQRLNAQNPDRAVHIIAHSLGSEVALEALHHVPAGTVSRMISMTGASFQNRARQAMQTEGGHQTELINVTSRENDAFDFMFECLTSPFRPGDRAMGQGVDHPNAVTLQLDCPHTLQYLNGLGAPLGVPDRRICHWSSYTRPGILRFYNRLLRHPEAFPLEALRHGLPQLQTPRWSRLVRMPVLRTPLPFVQKAS
ncbi:alpha/beta hydrolase [Thalassococcus sp. S3]|uniref:alpha/beta hydrolase n=1 Tax=Thalassococcus sp. S3 TaxID=2017482 RepID=UPI0020C2F4B3|nr:alpha/beta hydrolase [Thalassococcus sp. S3]